MNSPVEQIKSRLNIIDVVQSYLRLQKAGVNYRALCPFHSEKTPSFFVSPIRDSWHCFGCNRGGDIFSFIMEIEGMEFPEALKILASRAGVELKPIDQKYKSERIRLLQLMEEAKKFYEAELKKNQEVINYLKERGVKGETAKNFGIGYAPEGWRNLYDFLKGKNYSDAEIEKSGMVIKNQNAKIPPKARLAKGGKNQNYYDRFRSRIMFPVGNSSGQTVGFSGRIFNLETEFPSGNSVSSEPAKYINTPQTILYDKSKILYGFDKAKNEIRKKNQCILVEGQMDVIMSHQAGIANTVASSGTSLTKDHLNVIKRLTDNIVMAFDKDEAGVRAAGRGVDMALADGFDVRVAVVPLGKDPADAIKKSPDEWKNALEKAKNVIEFYLVLFKGDRKKIEKIVLPYVAILPSEIDKAHWMAEIARQLKINEEAVWEELKKINITKTAEPTSDVGRPGSASRLHLLQSRLTGFILWQKNIEDKELKAVIDKFIRDDNFDLNNLNLPQEQLIFEAELFYSRVGDLKTEFEKLISEFKKEEIKSELVMITNKIRELEGKDESEIENYLSKFHELVKKLNLSR